MSKDAVATMGAVLSEEVSERDAVHVAVIAVTADSKLVPGQDIGILTGRHPNGDHIASTRADEMIGIVDPFIKGTVWPNQRFWMFLYPRTITALSHRWSHPSFPDAGTAEVYAPPSSKLSSEQWIRDFAQRSDCPGYEALMAKAAEIADGRNDAWDDDYMHWDGSDAHGEIPPEFWDHAEIVLGRKIMGKRTSYFSCSC